MMEVKARKQRELLAEPVGRTHRCIPRYIRALGEKYETKQRRRSIQFTPGVHPLSPPLVLSRRVVVQRNHKASIRKRTRLESTGAVSGGRNGSAQKTHSCASFSAAAAACQNTKGYRKGGSSGGSWRGGGGEKLKKDNKSKYSITVSTGLNLPKKVVHYST